MVKTIRYILVLLLFLFIASGRIESSDGLSALNVARNIVCCGSVEMAPPEYSGGLQTKLGRDGKYYSPTSLGSSLLYLPAAAGTKFFYALNNFEQGKYFPLQLDYVLTFFASFTNPILAFILFLVNCKIFKLFIKKDTSAFFLSFIISFSTNLLPLAKHSFFHIPFALFLSLSFYYILLFAEREKNDKYLVLSSICFGLAILTYNLIFIIILAIYLVFLWFNLKDWKPIYKWLLSMIPFVLIVGYFNFIRFGSPFNLGYDFNAFDLKEKGNVLKGAFGLLFSSGKSVFLYSPLLILSYIYAIKTFKKDYISRFIIFLTIILTLAYGGFVFWSGDLAWGPRYMSILIPFAGIILARNWNKINKPILYFLAIIGLFIQLEGVTVPYEYQYPVHDQAISQKAKPKDRRSQFEYWSIGHFTPRYSPIWVMKKETAKRLINIPKAFPKKSKVVFAHGTSRPYKSDSGYYKIGRSILYLYAKENIEFQNITLTTRNMRGNGAITGANICLSGNCIKKSSIKRNGDRYKISLPRKIILPERRYAIIQLKPDHYSVKDFDYDLYYFALNDYSFDLSDFQIGLLDHFSSKKAPFDYNGQEFYRYYNQKFKLDETINTLPDFWWIHPFIFYNFPLKF